MSFRSTASGRHVQVKHSDIDTAEWLRVAKGFGLKVMSREGNVFKFDGFKDSVSKNMAITLGNINVCIDTSHCHVFPKVVKCIAFVSLHIASLAVYLFIYSITIS